MNNEIKVNLNIALKGRVMLSEQVAQNKPENYDLFSMEVSDEKGKNRERIIVKTRKTIPARQSVNLSEDAYKSMIDKKEVPHWIKAGKWASMSNKQRLESHLNKIAEHLGGTVISYKVFED